MKPLINPREIVIKWATIINYPYVSVAYRFIFLWFKFANVRFAPQAPDNQEAIDDKIDIFYFTLACEIAQVLQLFIVVLRP